MDGHIKPCSMQILIFFQSGSKDMHESALGIFNISSKTNFCTKPLPHASEKITPPPPCLSNCPYDILSNCPYDIPTKSRRGGHYAMVKKSTRTSYR